MASLPKDRLQVAPPFSKVGVDYHLQARTQTKSLETDVFINGPPSDTYSDNGTNFVRADQEFKQSLEERNQSQISDFLSQKDIQWHFNPPYSPHFGGIWERLVQSCKKALKWHCMVR